MSEEQVIEFYCLACKEPSTKLICLDCRPFHEDKRHWTAEQVIQHFVFGAEEPAPCI